MLVWVAGSCCLVATPRHLPAYSWRLTDCTPLHRVVCAGAVCSCTAPAPCCCPMLSAPTTRTGPDSEDEEDEDEDPYGRILGYDDHGVPILAGDYDSEEDSDYESPGSSDEDGERQGRGMPLLSGGTQYFVAGNREFYRPDSPAVMRIVSTPGEREVGWSARVVCRCGMVGQSSLQVRDGGPEWWEGERDGGRGEGRKGSQQCDRAWVLTRVGLAAAGACRTGCSAGVLREKPGRKGPVLRVRLWACCCVVGAGDAMLLGSDAEEDEDDEESEEESDDELPRGRRDVVFEEITVRKSWFH